MTLDEAYRHIKASYIHHLQENNAVFLPQAELIAMECIEKCKQLKKQKAADVQPIKHGKWLSRCEGDIYEFSECSECGNTESCETPYCAQCGARMIKDGEQNEVD